MSKVFEGILSIAGMKRGGEHAILVFHGSQGSVAKSHKGPKGKEQALVQPSVICLDINIWSFWHELDLILKIETPVKNIYYDEE